MEAVKHTLHEYASKSGVVLGQSPQPYATSASDFVLKDANLYPPSENPPVFVRTDKELRLLTPFVSPVADNTKPDRYERSFETTAAAHDKDMYFTPEFQSSRNQTHRSTGSNRQVNLPTRSVKSKDMAASFLGGLSSQNKEQLGSDPAALHTMASARPLKDNLHSSFSRTPRTAEKLTSMMKNLNDQWSKYEHQHDTPRLNGLSTSTSDFTATLGRPTPSKDAFITSSSSKLLPNGQTVVQLQVVVNRPAEAFGILKNVEKSLDTISKPSLAEAWAAPGVSAGTSALASPSTAAFFSKPGTPTESLDSLKARFEQLSQPRSSLLSAQASGGSAEHTSALSDTNRQLESLLSYSSTPSARSVKVASEFPSGPHSQTAPSKANLSSMLGSLDDMMSKYSVKQPGVPQLDSAPLSSALGKLSSPSGDPKAVIMKSRAAEEAKAWFNEGSVKSLQAAANQQAGYQAASQQARARSPVRYSQQPIVQMPRNTSSPRRDSVFTSSAWIRSSAPLPTRSKYTKQSFSYNPRDS